MITRRNDHGLESCIDNISGKTIGLRVRGHKFNRSRPDICSNWGKTIESQGNNVHKPFNLRKFFYHFNQMHYNLHNNNGTDDAWLTIKKLNDNMEASTKPNRKLIHIDSVW